MQNHTLILIKNCFGDSVEIEESGDDFAEVYLFPNLFYSVIEWRQIAVFEWLPPKILQTKEGKIDQVRKKIEFVYWVSVFIVFLLFLLYCLQTTLFILLFLVGKQFGCKCQLVTAGVIVSEWDLYKHKEEPKKTTDIREKLVDFEEFSANCSDSSWLTSIKSDVLSLCWSK